MGFFSSLFKGPEPPEHPLDYYLNQRSIETLVSAGEVGLNVGFDHYPTMPVTYYGIGKYEKYLLEEESTEPIPNWYDYIKCIEIFKVAASKGSGNAAFYLGIMYEHGIGVEADQAIADDYYDMASVAEQSAKPLVDVINAIKKKMPWPEYMDNQYEILAMNLWCNNVELNPELIANKDTYHYPMVAALNESDREIYLFISSYLVWFYAEKKSVWFMGTLGQVLMKYEKFDKTQFYPFKFNPKYCKANEFGVTKLSLYGLNLYKKLFEESQNGNVCAYKYLLESGKYYAKDQVMNEPYV